MQRLFKALQGTMPYTRLTYHEQFGRGGNSLSHTQSKLGPTTQPTDQPNDQQTQRHIGRVARDKNRRKGERERDHRVQ